MKRDSTIFYRSFYDAIKDLPAEEFKAAMTAIMEYALDGTENPEGVIAATVLKLVKPQIDANNRRYENGKKGGRPKTEEEPSNNQKKPRANQNKPSNNQKKPSTNQNKPKRENEEPNVNVNDNVDVNVNDNDIKKIKDTPPKPSPKTVTSMIEERGYSPTLKDAVMDWVKYKRERKEGYVETGLTKLLTEIANNAKEFGDDAVIDIINKSIAAQWKGILWKALKEERDANKGANPWADYRDPYEEWRQKGEGVGGDAS